MTAPAETEEKALVKITNYMDAPIVKSRFAGILGERGASTYISSVLIVVANSKKLQECTPASIYTAALRAATLRISVDPGIGQAYVVPYGRTANLIVGYKGLHDMAIRTGKYRYLNVGRVWEGQEVLEDQITGFHSIVGLPPHKDEEHVIGWIGAFALYSGYSKTMYMTVEEIHEHAKKYSQSYYGKDSPWQTETRKMERKTVLRLLLRRWGYMDPADVQVLDEIETEHEDTVDAQFSDLAENLNSQEGEAEPEPERTVEENLSQLGFAPEPNAPPEWPTAKLQVLIKAGLAKDAFSAKGMLGLSNLRPDDPDDILKAWALKYREKRGTNPTRLSPSAKESADYANAAMPRP